MSYIATKERYASHQDDVKIYNTEKLRSEFLIESC